MTFIRLNHDNSHVVRFSKEFFAEFEGYHFFDFDQANNSFLSHIQRLGFKLFTLKI